MTYRPLPSYITIRDSGIHGLGLFATKKIEAHTIIGVGWIKDTIDSAENGLWRTPLGGFINHSDTPNCIKSSVQPEIIYIAVGNKDIGVDEELTIKYTLYHV